MICILTPLLASAEGVGVDCLVKFFVHLAKKNLIKPRNVFRHSSEDLVLVPNIERNGLYVQSLKPYFSAFIAEDFILNGGENPASMPFGSFFIFHP